MVRRASANSSADSFCARSRVFYGRPPNSTYKSEAHRTPRPPCRGNISWSTALPCPSCGIAAPSLRQLKVLLTHALTKILQQLCQTFRRPTFRTSSSRTYRVHQRVRPVLPVISPRFRLHGTVCVTRALELPSKVMILRAKPVADGANKRFVGRRNTQCNNCHTGY